MNQKQKVITWSLSGGLAFGLIAVLVITLTQSGNLKPISINLEDFTMENYSESDPSNDMEYYYDTVHLETYSYAIGASKVEENILPNIRKLDTNGNLIENYFFGLDALDIDPNTFMGDVNIFRQWEANNSFVISIDVHSHYIQNGQSFLLSGPLGNLLDARNSYDTYLRLVIELSFDFTEINLLYIMGDQGNVNPFYDLYDVIVHDDTLWLGFSYTASQHQLPFAFNNPRPEGEGSDYLLQRFQYQGKQQLLKAMPNENLIFASDFYELLYPVDSQTNYLPSAIVNDYLSINLRYFLQNGVSVNEFNAWLNALTIGGIAPSMLESIKTLFLNEFNALPSGEPFFYPAFDAVMVLNMATRTLVGFVLIPKVAFAASIFNGLIVGHQDKQYFALSVRHYGGDPVTNLPIQDVATTLYELTPEGLLLVSDFEGLEPFFAHGAILTENGMVFYGHLLNENQSIQTMLNTHAYLMEWDIEDETILTEKILSSSGNDGIYDVRINWEDDRVAFYLYVENQDEDFISLANNQDYYMTVKLNFSIE